MKQIGKSNRAVVQGKSGYTVKSSEEVFTYLGLQNGDKSYTGFIDGKDFVLSRSMGPGLKVKEYAIRNDKKSNLITLPRVWADNAGVVAGSLIATFEDHHCPDPQNAIPIIRIRSLVNSVDGGTLL